MKTHKHHCIEERTNYKGRYKGAQECKDQNGAKILKKMLLDESELIKIDLYHINIIARINDDWR